MLVPSPRRLRQGRSPGWKGVALESAAARIRREAGGLVTTNVMVGDLDLSVPNAADARRLEVVVDGLPLFGGAQLAVDTTLVCSPCELVSPKRSRSH